MTRKTIPILFLNRWERVAHGRFGLWFSKRLGLSGQRLSPDDKRSRPV